MLAVLNYVLLNDFFFKDAGTARIGAFSAGNAQIWTPATSKTRPNYRTTGVGGGLEGGRRTPGGPIVRPQKIFFGW